MFALIADAVQSIERVSNLKKIKTKIKFNNTEYKFINLYKEFYNLERKLEEVNDYVIFLKNGLAFNTEKIENILEKDIIKYNFSSFFKTSCKILFNGVFLIDKKIGLVINHLNLKSIA